MRIAIDCEFSFDQNNDFVCICAAVTQEDGITQTWWCDKMYELAQYLKMHKADTFVAHNIETAEGYLFQSLGIKPTSYRWHDTLLESLVAYNRCTATKYRHDLATCLKREGIAVRDHDEKKEDQMICVWEPTKKTWDEHLAYVDSKREHLLAYCLEDTKHLLKLDDQLQIRLNTAEIPDRSHHMDVDTPLEKSRRPHYYGFLAAILSEISWRGIPMNPQRVKRLTDNAPRAIFKQQDDFNAQYPGCFRQIGGKFTMNTKVVRDYATQAYGANPPKTKTGQVSLSSDNLKPYKDSTEDSVRFLRDYYYMSKYCRALASFCKKERDKNWMSGYSYGRQRIRPALRMFRAATGRLGMQPSSGFTYTMGKPFRGLIDPPKGRVIVELDFHSEEVACQAYLSGDKVMTQMYQHPQYDNDYYTDVAHSIDPTVTKKSDKRRDTYKVVALMLNYGAGAKKLASVVNLDIRKCFRICQHLKKQFKHYWQFVEKAKRSCNRQNALWFSDGWRIHYYPSGKQTTLGNFPFQGVGAYILRLILIECWRQKIDVIAPIHDAIAFECDEATWKETAEKVAQIMRDCSKRALGIEVDVGKPEVTFHGLVNCHSDLSSREAYAELYELVRHYEERMEENPKQISKAEKYLHDFYDIMNNGKDGEADLDAPWMDEFDDDEKSEEKSVNPLAQTFFKCYI